MVALEDCVGFVFERNSGADRSENLFPRYLHLVLHVGEERRFYEVPFAAAHFPTGSQFGTFFLTYFKIPFNPIELLARDQRTQGTLLVEWVADADIPTEICQLINDFIITVALHEYPCASTADLPRVKVDAHHRGWH